MMDWVAAAELYRQAALLNRQDELRRGCLLELPGYGQVVMTGDLHGHCRNFRKLVRFCDLAHARARHVILHELLHEEPASLDAPDMSCQLVLEAARWKVEFPEQVHFLQGNHEFAQITGREIVKGGRSVQTPFCAGLAKLYGPERVDEVLAAMCEFLKSFALAARAPRGIFMAHSLPDENRLDEFDLDLFERDLCEQDFAKHSAVSLLLWGRRHTEAVLDRFAERFGVELFIVGHQPQETGYRVVGERLLILASDHARGVFLPIDLSRAFSMPELVARIRPFAAIP